MSYEVFPRREPKQADRPAARFGVARISFNRVATKLLANANAEALTLLWDRELGRFQAKAEVYRHDMRHMFPLAYSADKKRAMIMARGFLTETGLRDTGVMFLEWKGGDLGNHFEWSLEKKEELNRA